MNKNQPKPNVDQRQKQAAAWIAAVFSVFSLVFLAYSIYIVVAVQNGRFDISDKILMPLTALMLAVSFFSYILIRSNRQVLAAGLLFIMITLVPSVITVLVLKGFIVTAIAYIVLMGSIVIGLALPRTSRRPAILAALFTILFTVGIDLWDPPFRVPTAIGGFTNIVIVLAVISLFAFSIQQAWRGNIRTKLLVSVLLITILTVGILGFVNYYNTTITLTASAGSSLKSIASSQSNAISNLLTQRLDILQAFALSKVVQDRVDEANASYGPDKTLNQQIIDRYDLQWRAADKANNDNNPLVTPVLNGEVASELREFRNTFPENVEVFVTDKYGANVAATNRTSDYYQADEGWWQAAYNNGKGAVYIGQPEYDESSKTFALILAVPLYAHGTLEVTGVMRTTINIDGVFAILNTEILDGSAETYLYLPDNQVLDPKSTQSLVPADPNAIANMPEMLITQSVSFPYEGKAGIVSAAPVTSTDPDNEQAFRNLGWIIVTHQDEDAVLEPIRQQAQSTIVLVLIFIGLSASASLFVAQTLTSPIVRLTAVAEQIAAGDNNLVAKVESSDEVGALAGSFNSMTAQLRELIGSLEQRVEDRTRALATSTEVSRRLSTILDLQQLVTEVVEQVKNSFNYYHAHIYLMDEFGKELIMAGGTGEAGKIMLARGHKIPVGKGLVGLAAETKELIRVSDTSEDPDWLPNPLLPDTKSEIAVPIMLGDRVLGVLDVQQNIKDGLSEEDSDLIQSIAYQVATALRNAQVFSETQQKAERETLINEIGRKIQNTASVEQALQVAARELGQALGARDSRAIIDLQSSVITKGN